MQKDTTSNQKLHSDHALRVCVSFCIDMVFEVTNGYTRVGRRHPAASRFQTHSSGLREPQRNPLEWVLDLIAAGEAIGSAGCAKI